MSPARGVAEVVVPPRSSLIGLHVFPGMCTPSGDLVILGVRRGEEAFDESGTERAPKIKCCEGRIEDIT